jgi:hypothetical protein
MSQQKKGNSPAIRALPDLVHRLPKVQSILDEFESPSAVERNKQETLLFVRLRESGTLAAVAAVLDQAEDLQDLLEQANVSDHKEVLQEFAIQYLNWRSLLLRLFREEQGYVNEMTTMTVRPFLLLKNGEPVVSLDLYSHGKVLLNSTQGLSGFVMIAAGMVSNATEYLNYADSIRPNSSNQLGESDPYQTLKQACEQLLERLS